VFGTGDIVAADPLHHLSFHGRDEGRQLCRQRDCDWVAGLLDIAAGLTVDSPNPAASTRTASGLLTRVSQRRDSREWRGPELRWPRDACEAVREPWADGGSHADRIRS